MVGAFRCWPAVYVFVGRQMVDDALLDGVGVLWRFGKYFGVAKCSEATGPAAAL